MIIYPGNSPERAEKTASQEAVSIILFRIQQVDGSQNAEGIVAGIVAVGDEHHPDLGIGHGGTGGGELHIPGGDAA